MIFGYARVSTKDQNLDSQIIQLQKLGAERIFSDVMSGKNTQRPEFNKMLELLREGDTIVVCKLDRLTRSLSDLILLLDQFSKMKIKVQLGALKFDFTTSEGRLFSTIFGAFAQFERDLIRERTIKGLESARAQGRVGGKPKGLSSEALKKAKKAFELREKGLTVPEIMKAVGIKSTRTFYKYIRDYNDILVENNQGSVSEDGLKFYPKI